MRTKSDRYSHNNVTDNIDFDNLSSSETKQLNLIAGKLQVKYTEFVDEYCERYGKNYFFWATPFASRNVYHSDCFLSICKIFLAKELMNQKRITRIVVSDSSEKKALLSALNIDYFITVDERNEAKEEKWFASIESFIEFCRSELSYSLYSKKYKKRKLVPESVVITSTLSSQFDDDYYNDRYFTGITKYKPVVFLPYIVVNTKTTIEQLIKSYRNCVNYDFLLPFEFLHFIDLFEIIKYWREIDSLMKKRYYFEGLDVSPLVHRCLARGKRNITSFKGLLMRKALKRMSDNIHSIKNFLIWYEGRPCDILTASAVREFFPEANCVGYEGFPLTESNLAEFVSDYQYSSGHSPCAMAIPGTAYERDARKFCGDIPILRVPILRNEYVISCKKSNTSATPRILIVLSYFDEAIRDQIVFINEYYKKNNDCKVIIKNHPVHNGYTVTDYGFHDLLFEPDYAEGDLNECLEDIDVVVASLTSATLEVVFKRIPLIIVCPKGGLVYTALPSIIRDKTCRVVYDVEEFVDAMEQRDNIVSISDEELKGMLVPKSRDTINQMFIRT